VTISMGQDDVFRALKNKKWTTPEDIANIIGISEKSVKKNLSKMQKYDKRLQKEMRRTEGRRGWKIKKPYYKLNKSISI